MTTVQKTNIATLSECTNELVAIQEKLTKVRHTLEAGTREYAILFGVTRGIDEGIWNLFNLIDDQQKMTA
ncbi:MAG: hypothetical protein P4L79_10105 [Legionella sp.]|uniref:hypothetical protein n=1 Tax=Legionella sp. TaxID=459 RepID=UPI00284D18FF|nr:hypothetical protein [Legionella sp.]